MIVCSRAEDFLASLPTDSVDLVFGSPPYDAIRGYQDGHTVDLQAVGAGAQHCLRDGGFLAMVMQDQTKNHAKSGTTFRTAVGWMDLGLRMWECMVYKRPGIPGGWWNRRFRVDHEYILVFFKGRRPTYFDKSHMTVPCVYAGAKAAGTVRKTDGTTEPIAHFHVAETKCGGTVRDYEPTKSEPGLPKAEKKLKQRHPATFPQALASDLIRAFCPDGGLVVDPFTGSGTTWIEAARHGRKFLGCDASLAYCKQAKERYDYVEQAWW